MNNMLEKVVIVYGFDYEYKIWDVNTKGAILCKSICTNLPVYATPYIIEETEMTNIIEKIKEIESTQPEIFDNIKTIAKIRNTTTSWKIVLYNGCGIRSRVEDNHAYSEGRRRSPEEYDNLKINVGYESEGDEDGNGR